MTVYGSTAELTIPAAFRRVSHGFSFSLDEAQSRVGKLNEPVIHLEETRVNDNIIDFERRSRDAGRDSADDETDRTVFVLHRGDVRTFARSSDAQAYIEEFIGSGVDPQEIQAFEGCSLRVEVSFNPVVSLGANVETHSRGT